MQSSLNPSTSDGDGGQIRKFGPEIDGKKERPVIFSSLFPSSLHLLSTSMTHNLICSSPAKTKDGGKGGRKGREREREKEGEMNRNTDSSIETVTTSERS